VLLFFSLSLYPSASASSLTQRADVQQWRKQCVLWHFSSHNTSQSAVRPTTTRGRLWRRTLSRRRLKTVLLFFFFFFFSLGLVDVSVFV